MSAKNDWMTVNREAFGREFLRYHSALRPVMSREGLRELGDEPAVKRALDGMIAELKKHRMKLDWFQKRL